MSETIGEFSATRVSWSLSKTVDGQFQQTSCYEGNAEGFGVVYGTLNITRPLSEAGDFSGGTCTYAGMGQAGIDTVLTRRAEVRNGRIAYVQST